MTNDLATTAKAAPQMAPPVPASKNDGKMSAQAQSTVSTEGRQSPSPSADAKANAQVFGEASKSLAKSAPSVASQGSAPTAGDNPPADADVPALPISRDLTAAMAALVTGDDGYEAGDDASSEGFELPRRGAAAAAADAPAPGGRDEADAVETGTAGRADGAGAGDAVITAGQRAASFLAGAADTSVFGFAALGVAANFADFVAPAIVDGIEDPLVRGAAAAGFAGIFLGLTASVTTALGQDIAAQITQDRIKEPEPTGDVGLGGKLMSAVKNQTIPAYVGFSAAFVTANAIDADANVMGDTDPNPTTVFLKLARATAGGVFYGLAQEAAKQMGEHELSHNDADRVMDNTRKLGEAIKKNVTSLPQALSAYTRPTEQGKPTEFGNVLGAAFGFAAFAAISGAVNNTLQDEYGEESESILQEAETQTAIAVATGVAGFVLADQLVRNIYANVIPTREAPATDVSGADDGDVVDIPEIDTGDQDRRTGV